MSGRSPLKITTRTTAISWAGWESSVWSLSLPIALNFWIPSSTTAQTENTSLWFSRSWASTFWKSSRGTTTKECLCLWSGGLPANVWLVWTTFIGCARSSTPTLSQRMWSFASATKKSEKFLEQASWRPRSKVRTTKLSKWIWRLPVPSAITWRIKCPLMERTRRVPLKMTFRWASRTQSSTKAPPTLRSTIRSSSRDWLPSKRKIWERSCKDKERKKIRKMHPR